MLTKPYISVIIPHLNQPEPLARCLRSLEKQIYPRERFEVIVVDNGSEVFPTDIVAGFKGARLSAEGAPGPGPARNRGVEMSRGLILAFIDADCIAEEGWLDAIAQTLERPDTKVVAGGNVRIAVRDAKHPTAIEAYESVFAFQQKEYIEKMGFSGAGNLAVYRRNFNEIGPFLGIDVAEDREWGRRAVACGFDLVYVKDMVVYHPARKSLGELCAKWDRHICHDFREWLQSGSTITRWVIRALAVALSPLLDANKVFARGRVFGARTQVLAIVLLFRIRLYRAALMIRLAANPRLASEELSWNRNVAP